MKTKPKAKRVEPVFFSVLGPDPVTLDLELFQGSGQLAWLNVKGPKPFKVAVDLAAAEKLHGQLGAMLFQGAAELYALEADAIDNGAPDGAGI